MIEILFVLLGGVIGGVALSVYAMRHAAKKPDGKTATAMRLLIGGGGGPPADP